MFTSIITFIVILSILVLVHELGHFLVAKKAGIKIEEFGFGLPPRIWGKKLGETTYSINALPIGGFVKLYGEDTDEKLEAGSPYRVNEKLERAFFAKSKKARLAVVVAGVTMNYLLSLFIFSLVAVKLGIPVKTDKVKVVGVAANSPAEISGLKTNDYIISANKERVASVEKFISLTQQALGQEMILEVSREENNPCWENIPSTNSELSFSCSGQNLILSVIPRKDPPQNEGALGVVISQTEIKFYPLPKQIFLGTIEGFKESLGWLGLITKGLGTMVNQLFQGTIPKDVAGPIGIFQVTGEVSKGGILSQLQFLAILSVNLAVINILPLPALDGGRVLFILIEAITRKKVNQELEAKIHNFGLMILLLLLLLITINDVIRILQASGVLNQLRSILPL